MPRYAHKRPGAPRTATPPAPVAGARWIPLTRGAFALVDEADFERVSHYNWHLTKNGYAASSHRLLHRFVMNAGPKDKIDHRNNEAKLDCRRSNLRLATHSQNLHNRPVQKNNASAGMKGVSRCVTTGRWRARIKVAGKNVWLGRFATKEEAARAYDEAARRLVGEFAYGSEVA